jgi:hypothetical protein
LSLIFLLCLDLLHATASPHSFAIRICRLDRYLFSFDFLANQKCVSFLVHILCIVIFVCLRMYQNDWLRKRRKFLWQGCNSVYEGPEKDPHLQGSAVSLSKCVVDKCRQNSCSDSSTRATSGPGNLEKKALAPVCFALNIYDHIRTACRPFSRKFCLEMCCGNF